MSVPIKPAATVMLLREAGDGAQVLMLRRSRNLVFGPGIWVFPGGRVDSADYADGADSGGAAGVGGGADFIGGANAADGANFAGNAAGTGEMQAARTAAVREAAEEAGVEVPPDQLLLFAHWTTPEGPPRRFATWFFAAALQDDAAVSVDGQEIQDHFWAHPAEVLHRHARGELELYEPTWMSLNLIAECDTLSQMQRTLEQTPCAAYQGRMVALPDGGTCHLYQGDAAYENLDLNAPGARQRLWAQDAGWRYEHRPEQT